MTSDAVSYSGQWHSVAGRQSKLWIAVAAIACIGLVLRLVAASGDLWLDEIWSLELIAKVSSIDQIFWRINHDNNHFLNSAYLYLTGPGVSPIAHRAMSIVFGIATVFAAAAVTADRGQATQLVASLLFAVSYPMVHYGSEARGYSGLVLFSLLAVLFLQRRLDGRGGAVALAVAILLGFLSHLTMLFTVAVLVPWAAWDLLKGGRGPVRAGLRTAWIFLPALLAVLPLAACVAIGAKMFGLTVGSLEPFSLDLFAAGYGGMIRYLFGLHLGLSDWGFIAAACCAVCVTAWKWPSRRASLYLMGIVGLPLLMAQLALPNMEYPRYFLTSGVFLLLWSAEVLGRGFDAAGTKRGVATVALVGLLVANGASVWRFYDGTRGSYAPIVERMTAGGPAAYASSNEFRTPKIVAFFAKGQGREAKLVIAGDWCAKQPDWLIVDIGSNSPKAVEQAPDCDLVYDNVMTSRSWGLSGTSWTLYKKRPGAPQVLSELDALRLTPVMR